MAKVVEVVYDNGVFKPAKKVILPKKTRGKVIIEEKRWVTLKKSQKRLMKF